ncbi:MAG: two-component system LytT family response regulator [Saprospiraceae bacterium]|jgi:two-component system LytT family response regulator
MNSIKCLIVDDEPPAIILLEKYAGMIEQLEVVGTCQSAVKVFDVLRRLM